MDIGQVAGHLFSSDDYHQTPIPTIKFHFPCHIDIRDDDLRHTYLKPRITCKELAFNGYILPRKLLNLTDEGM